MPPKGTIIVAVFCVSTVLSPCFFAIYGKFYNKNLRICDFCCIFAFEFMNNLI